MLFFIDRLIENKFKIYFHSKKDLVVNKYLQRYIDQHPGLETKELNQKLIREITRLYPMIDRSILRDRVRRSSWYFWFTLLGTTLFLLSLNKFNLSPLTYLIMPPATSLITWSGALFTLPISYFERLKGGMESVVTLHKTSSAQKLSASVSCADVVIDIEKMNGSCKFIVVSLADRSVTLSHDAPQQDENSKSQVVIPLQVNIIVAKSEEPIVDESSTQVAPMRQNYFH